MAQRSRELLKSWFQTGDKPTQEQFKDLIDSCYNIEDDVAIFPLVVCVKQKITSLTDGDNLIDPEIPSNGVIVKVQCFEIDEATAINQIDVDCRLENDRKFTLTTPVSIHGIIINTFYYNNINL